MADLPAPVRLVQAETTTVLALGTAQTLAWASSYYLPAIIADSIAIELGISSTMVFSAFSASLLLSALLGPRVGRSIDTFGGRGVLATSNLVFAAGLCGLGLAHDAVTVWLAWAVIGIGMGLGLYDAAFAALGSIYGVAARRPITGITLLAGFASTVGWPLSAWGVAEIGWRPTCFAWAAAHVLIGLPLNLGLPAPLSDRCAVTQTDSASIAIDRTMVLLAVAFAAGWMVTAAIGAHLPRILLAGGATQIEAVAAAALMGPAQVAARIAEAWLMARQHPLVSARLSTLAHPVGAAILFGMGGGGIAAAALTLLHGAGNGVLTIARGTVPLALYGPNGYGYRLGVLGSPARIAQASAPVLFGVLIDLVGVYVLVFTAGLSIVAFAALCATPSRPVPGSQPA